MLPRVALLSLTCCFPLLTSCTFLGKSDQYNGLTGQQGKPVVYYSSTRVGLSLLFVIPIVGEPTVTRAIDDMTERIKDDGGKNVRMVQSDSTAYWYLLPPLTFIIQPAVASCTADAEFDGPAAPAKKAAPKPKAEAKDKD